MIRPATHAVAILGVGSILHGDDGLGPVLVERLRSRFRFAPGVILDDVGTPGPSLVHALEDLHAVIIVDAVRGDPPGQLRRYDREAILAGWDGHGGCHDPGLAEALLLTELLGRSPCHVVLVGLTIGAPTPGLELTSTVRGALPALEKAVLDELRDVGVVPTPTATADRRTWWSG